MRILYDHQTFSQQEFGGISRYFCELIVGLNQIPTIQARLSLLFSNNAHLRESGMKVYPFLPSDSFPKKLEIIYFINSLKTTLDLRHGNYNIFHATNYDPYFLPNLKGKPFVVTFHDAIHEKFSGKYKELNNVAEYIDKKRLLVERARAVIAISESAKKDLVEIHNINPDKIHVVYHSSSFGHKIDESIYDSPGVPYLLYVGKRDAYKNFPTFLTAVSRVLKRHNVNLLCAGGGGFTAEEKSLIRSLKLEQVVTQKPINDKILQQLYKSARAFVFPSLYEGFGIPVLEAFACSCPCILSDTSSLPEVAGEAALYFNPTDEHSIAQAVEQIITNDILRDSLISLGQKRLTMFSWQRTVTQTLAVYETCL